MPMLSFMFLLVSSLLSATQSKESVSTFIARDRSADLLMPEITGSRISVSDEVDVSEKYTIKRIEVSGNHRTREDVIRMASGLHVGDVISIQDLARAQRRVEALGCFEKNGVMWIISRMPAGGIGLECAVLEVNKGLSGRVNGGVASYSPGDVWKTPVVVPGAPEDRVYYLKPNPILYLAGCGAEVAHKNLLGGGERARVGVSSNLYKSSVEASLAVPCATAAGIGWGVSSDFTVMNDEYAYDWVSRRESGIKRFEESVVGFRGFIQIPLERFVNDVYARLDGGLERTVAVAVVSDDLLKAVSLAHENPVDRDAVLTKKALEEIEGFGVPVWLACTVQRDTRDHVDQPTRGTCYAIMGKVFVPSLDPGKSYAKFEASGCGYAPLTDNARVVLALGAKAGALVGISRDPGIPPRELYHIGASWLEDGFLVRDRDEYSQRAVPAWEGAASLGSRYVAGSVELKVALPVLKSWDASGKVFYVAESVWYPGGLWPARESVLGELAYNIKHELMRIGEIGPVQNVFPHASRDGDTFNARQVLGLGLSFAPRDGMTYDAVVGIKFDSDKTLSSQELVGALSASIAW